MPVILPAPEAVFEGAEETRECLEAETKRLTVVFGKAPFRGVEAEWTVMRGQWAIGNAWLLDLPTKRVNRGFRLTVGNLWILELWHEHAKLEYTSGVPIPAKTLTDLINAMYGVSKTGGSTAS